METTDLFGHTVTYRHCELSDIDQHFEVIRDVVTDVPENAFKTRMMACIPPGTAYCLEDGQTFLYYLPVPDAPIGKTKLAHGIALNGGPDPIKFIAMLRGIFNDNDQQIVKIDFKLHPGKLLSEYKSLILPTSAERYDENTRPLSVRVDYIRKKLQQLYAQREFHERSH